MKGIKYAVLAVGFALLALPFYNHGHKPIGICMALMAIVVTIVGNSKD